MQNSSAIQYLAIDTIHESTTNPRRTFEESKLQELAESIRHHGLIQPVTVRPNADGFELIAGARRLPGFTNCKPKYRKPDGLFPFVRLKNHTGEQYPMAQAFEQKITQMYEAREQERETRRQLASLSPRSGPRSSSLSLERFRTLSKYQDRPAAADIAFCVAAFADGMAEDAIETALEGDYLSRDPSPSKRAAYIRRTIEKARDWAER